MFFQNARPARPLSDALICSVAIDAEEDFDWNAPVFGTPYTTTCMHHIREMQAIVTAYGIVPTYLLTYPVLDDLEATRIVRRYLERGECEVGAQLHPWVTPPFDGETGLTESYSGNIGPDLEARKLARLTARFIERFGQRPRVYRAGRYGLSDSTARQLEEAGFEIDTSLAPRTDLSAEGGPDYSGFGYRPFWFGRARPLLELPLCRDIVGWGGAAAPAIYRAAARPAGGRLRLPSIVTRARAAERITLSPEGNDLRAMMRLVRGLRQSGVRMLVVSLHSSSLVVGRSPYVRDRAELHRFYDRLSGILDFLAAQQPVQFAALTQFPALLAPPTA